MDLFARMTAYNYGEVHVRADAATGLRAIVAIHDTRLGPSLGGCRFIHYADEASAFTDAECAAWPQMLRAAAMRTWLGRLGYHHFPRDSELTHPKDHPFTERLLGYHIAESDRHLATIRGIGG